MNKSILIAVVVLIAVAGGLFYMMKAPVSSPTTTQVVVNNNQTQGTKPLAVTSGTVATSDTTAVVTGTVTPNGASTSYWYEYGATSNLGSKSTNQNVGSGFVAIQAPGYIVNLAKNTTYYFRLVAENQYGQVAGSQFTFKTTEGNPAPTGSAPTIKSVSASNISRSTANINGEVTPNKNETQYWFEYGKTPELGNVSAFSSAGAGDAKMSVSISLSDLEPETSYYFRLNGQNKFGTINGSILNFKTLGPAAATAPKVVTQNATALTSNSATLHGTITPNGADTKYWFEYSTDSLLGSVLLQKTTEGTISRDANATSVQADVSNLDSKMTYYFRLVGQNSQGTVRGSNLTFKTK